MNWHFPAALSLVVALAACGSSDEQRNEGFGELLPELRQLREQRSAEAAALQPVGAFPGLDPALIAGRSDSMMGAYIASREAVAGLVPGGASGTVTTWQTADGIGLMLSATGLLVQTRGLGADLHITDPGPTEALIARGGSGTVQRRYGFLDGTYRQQDMRFTCSVAPAGAQRIVLNGREFSTTRYDERCEGGGESFVNSFWRDARGPLIRQSIQWIGPDVGAVHLQRLVE